MNNLGVAYLNAIAEVAEEMLGPEHECVKEIAGARKSYDDNFASRIVVAVQSLPKVQRDDIFLTAKARVKDESDAMNWLSARDGPSGAIPPGETRH